MDKSIGRALYFYYVARKNLFYSSIEPTTSEEKFLELKNRLNDRWQRLKELIKNNWGIIIDYAKNHDAEKQKAKLILSSAGFYLDHTPNDWNDLESPVKLISLSDGKKLEVTISPIGIAEGWSFSSAICL